jgi:hypothetical protein
VPFAGACDDSGNNGGPDGVPTSSGPLPTLNPAFTPAALEPAQSTSGLYTISVPADWQQQPIGETQEETWRHFEAGILRAELAITCEPVEIRPGERWTVDDFIARDIKFLQQVPGTVFGEETSEFTLDGVQAKQFAYTTQFGPGVRIRQVAVYAVKGDCGWIMRLRIFGSGDAAAYVGLFGQIVQTFKTV